jgi:hypothetical protein
MLFWEGESVCVNTLTLCGHQSYGHPATLGFGKERVYEFETILGFDHVGLVFLGVPLAC